MGIMIAYKTFSQAPKENVPLGIPTDYPWVFRECIESEIENLKKDGWIVVTQEEYDNHVTALSDRYNAWEAAKAQLGVESIVNEAQRFGFNLIISFAAENILLGISQLGMTTSVRATTAMVVNALMTGSLYDAITEAKAIPLENKDAIFVTDARLLAFINKIETYLGIPLSETL